MGQYLSEDHIPVIQDVEYFCESKSMFIKYINMYMEETCVDDYLIDEWTINEDYLKIYWYNEDTDEELSTEVKTDIFLEWCKTRCDIIN